MTYRTKRYWTIYSSNRSTSKKLVDAIASFMTDFTMMSDHKPKVVDFNEYVELVRLGHLRYDKHGISEGEYIIVIPEHLTHYSSTITKIRTAIGDFKRGWYACRGERKRKKCRPYKARKGYKL